MQQVLALLLIPSLSPAVVRSLCLTLFPERLLVHRLLLLLRRLSGIVLLQSVLSRGVQIASLLIDGVSRSGECPFASPQVVLHELVLQRLGLRKVHVVNMLEPFFQ